jgi:hypothetical protein
MDLPWLLWFLEGHWVLLIILKIVKLENLLVHLLLIRLSQVRSDVVCLLVVRVPASVLKVAVSQVVFHLWKRIVPAAVSFCSFALPLSMSLNSMNVLVILRGLDHGTRSLLVCLLHLHFDSFYFSKLLLELLS